MLERGSVEHPDRALVVWKLQLQFSPHVPIEMRTALPSPLPSNRFLQGQDCLPGTVLIFQFVDRDPCSFARGTIQYPDNSELSLTPPIFDVDQISAAKLSFDPGQKGPASAQVVANTLSENLSQRVSVPDSRTHTSTRTRSSARRAIIPFNPHFSFGRFAVCLSPANLGGS
jgi:hypothetical protein